MGSFRLPASTKLGDFACTLATTPDGVVRCVPPLGPSKPAFANPACTDEVWQASWPILSVGAEVDTNTVSPTVKQYEDLLPKVVSGLKGREEYTGRLFERKGTVCTLSSSIPTFKIPYARYKGEISFKEFEPMPIVER